MWPFKKKAKTVATQFAPNQRIGFTQVDTTERFGANLTLGETDWIQTVPLNTIVRDPESMGLPPQDATETEVYAVASKLSRIRESLHLPSDGVYCPICHIANVSQDLLHTGCPKCGRELLKFGWD